MKTDLATPDITPAQIIALIKAVLVLAASFGLALDDKQVASIVSLAALVVPMALMVADAMIRKGRAQAAATKISDEDLGI